MEELDRTYDPQKCEPELIERWIEAGCYQRNEGTGDCTIVIPPPNVTGKLHMGHALDDTIQDAIVRHHRMAGYSTRWIIGCDHAGISTQTKVDKKLKAEGKSRLEMGREAFVDACWDWTRDYGGTIVRQIKRMGCSGDFEDEKFTLDPDYERAVRKVFCDWYHDDLIYRGKRIVNWCPHCRTAISDDEAEYTDEHGHLWYLRYPLVEPVDGHDHIVVATTRPETMLGDTGVAVSADDPFASRFVGAQVRLPIVDRVIPIFSDWHVDAGFGTGFVKVTPAHDPNDYAMGQDHDLPQINVLDETAHVVEGYGEFSAMDRDEAREAIVRWFADHDLLEKVEDHDHSVMHCYRCDTALEPWLSEQWFVAVDRLKGPAASAVEEGEVTFHPARWTNTYTTWMENLKDWCISRQLWWGHRIPVFTCEDCGWEDALMEDPEVCPVCGSHHVTQDPDVLDTWFSSQLWPFVTQGWPAHPEGLQGHYPTYALVTARDIIALWVARMVMSSLYFTDQVPFKDVVIYATILAKDGSRMSKSKGNGVDPMDLIERYGADAMRFNLLTLVTGNQDVRFDAQRAADGTMESPRTEQARALVTKIWNASRFVLMNMEGYEPGPVSADTPEDAWMLSRLAREVERASMQLEGYAFGDYARDLQAFFRNDFCDWYVELCKGRLNGDDGALRLQAQRNLAFVLDVSLRLMHPAMPFVTERIWDAMPATALDDHSADFLMMSPWPVADELADLVNDEAEDAFELARRVIQAARSLRARYRLSPREELTVAVRTDEAQVAAIEAQRDFIGRVGHISQLTVGAHVEKPAGAVSAVDGDLEIFVVLGGLVDLEAERARLEKERARAEKELAQVRRTLDNPGFMAKAAPEVVEAKRARATEAEELLERLDAQIADLG